MTMKKKKISVLLPFQKDESDAPIKIRIGVVRRGSLPNIKPRIWLMIWLGSAILFALVELFRHFFL